MPTIRKIESKAEQQFLVALVTSQSFLAAVASLIDGNTFASSAANRIAGWCTKHFRQYGTAPGKAIQHYYYTWSEGEHADKIEVEAIHDLLGYLSDLSDTGDTGDTGDVNNASNISNASSNDRGGINLTYLLGEFSRYLTKRRMIQLRDALDVCLAGDDQEIGLDAIRQFNTINLGEQMGTDPLNDRSVWCRAFAEPLEPLMDFPPDAEKFFAPAMVRDSLIGIQGPEKRGKTFWCIEFAFRALRKRNRVAFFEVGDLTEPQLIKRIGIRIAGLPLWEGQLRCKYPIKLEIEDKTPKVIFQEKMLPQVVTDAVAWRARRALFDRYKLKAGVPYLKISTHPNSSINVAGINGILERWKREEDFIPDVIIIDYADILAPETRRAEWRHEVNDTWKAMRKLSQVWRACVISPTQANAASYKAKTQTMSNFSEDKRKYAHVTGMLGLNQTQREKDLGLMRLNWLVLREADFHSEHCLWVAQCLPLCQAMVLAAL